MKRKKPVAIVYRDDHGLYTATVEGRVLNNILSLEIKVSNMKTLGTTVPPLLLPRYTVEQYLPRRSAKETPQVEVSRDLMPTREARTMTLQEAAARAYTRDTTMYRIGNPPGWKIKPTHLLNYLTCIIDNDEETPRWQPTLLDLLAEDWLVTE